MPSDDAMNGPWRLDSVGECFNLGEGEVPTGGGNRQWKVSAREHSQGWANQESSSAALHTRPRT